MMKVITIIILIIDTAETAENLMTDTATVVKLRQVKVNRNKITADTAALLVRTPCIISLNVVTMVIISLNDNLEVVTMVIISNRNIREVEVMDMQICGNVALVLFTTNSLGIFVRCAASLETLLPKLTSDLWNLLRWPGSCQFQR